MREQLQIYLLRSIYILLKPFKYKGFGMLTNFIGNNIFNPNNNMIVPLHTKSRFKIYLNDPYWVLLLFYGYEYESEVKFVLSKVLRENSLFIDCGANNGYWSIYAAEYIDNSSNIIAIEASSETYSRLKNNCNLNKCKFTCVHAAIDSESSKSVNIITPGFSHAGACIQGRKNLSSYEITKRETVLTTTINDLCSDYLAGNNAGSVIIKLDVEGAEIAALKGASKLYNYNILVVYEDLDSDKTGNVTGFLMEELGFDIYYFDTNNSLKLLKSLDQMLEIKRNTKIPHNFVACPRLSELTSILKEL